MRCVVTGVLVLLLAMACDRTESRRADAHGEPRRIASLSPALTATLVALGRADQVVGRTPWCQGVPQASVVGSSTDVDLERMVAIEPDLVVIQRSSRGVPPELARLAQERGWRLETLPCDSLEDLRGMGDRLQALCGPSAGGESLAVRWRAVLRPPAGMRKDERVVMLLPGAALRACGGGSYMADLWRVWGGRCWPEARGWPEVQIEDLVVARPDRVMVMGGPISPELANALALSPLRLESLPDPGLLQPGPDFLRAAEAWRATLEPRP